MLQVKGYIYHKESSSENNKGVYLGNWMFSYFVKLHFEVFEMSHSFPTQKSQLHGLHPSQTDCTMVQFIPFTVYKRKFINLLIPYSHTVFITKMAGKCNSNSDKLSFTLCPSSRQNALFQQWNLMMSHLAKIFNNLIKNAVKDLQKGPRQHTVDTVNILLISLQTTSSPCPK